MNAPASNVPDSEFPNHGFTRDRLGIYWKCKKTGAICCTSEVQFIIAKREATAQGRADRDKVPVKGHAAKFFGQWK